MKKLLGLIVIAGSLVACNNTSETNEQKDSVTTTTTTPLNQDTLNLNTGSDSLNNNPDSNRTQY